MRCGGETVLDVIIELHMGADLDPKKMRGCVHKFLMGGKVMVTTRDNWTIISWGDDYAGAFKLRKPQVDGAYVRINARATYLGVKQFARVDGGTATTATFRIEK